MPEAYHARLYPVERTPGGVATTQQAYSAGVVAPHAGTARWTYTTPTNKAAEIESVQSIIFRDGASGAAGVCYALIFVIGGSGVCSVYEQNGALGTVTQSQFGRAGFLAAGEQLRGQTADASVGGTHNFDCSARLREFPV